MPKQPPLPGQGKPRKEGDRPLPKPDNRTPCQRNGHQWVTRHDRTGETMQACRTCGAGG